ncbi:MAG: hypothetical protein DMF68_08625 [Acidobacteria bacterium]|nr:MAG: hypothetical protein DMF68_08625 [Acidobacteriota bacterium]
MAVLDDIHFGSLTPLRRLIITLAFFSVLILALLPPRSAGAAPGDLDPAFGNGGKVFVQFSDGSVANAVALQSDGRIILAGYAGPRVQDGAFSGQHFALARLNADGSLDQSFGTNGIVRTDIGDADMITGIALQTDGKIVAAGFVSGPGNVSNFALARYNTDGSLDTNYGSSGLILTAMGDGAASGNGLALQPDGRIVIAGTASVGSHPSFAVARYWSSNTPPQPSLLTEEGSERAVALDSVTLMRDHFPISTSYNFSADQRTRIMLFAINLELLAGEDVSAVTAQAEDSQHRIYPLTVEYIGKVPGFDWLTQVNVKLSDALANAGDVWLSIGLRGAVSSKVLVRIKQQ